jgi:hypothetical protein
VREGGLILDIEQSSNPARLEGAGARERFVADDLHGLWLTEWDFPTASRFLQPAASWTVTDAGREAVAGYNGLVNPGQDCVSQAVPFVMVWPALHDIRIGDDVTVIRSEWGERTIDMARNSHEGVASSNQGDSIGRWEGDTLVVDTAKLQAGTLFNNGVDYTEDVRLVERIRLANPNTLIVTQQFADPGSFEGTAARVMSFSRGNDHVYPYDCDPSYGLAMDSREGPAAD